MEALKIVRIEYLGVGIFCSPNVHCMHPIVREVYNRHNDFPNPMNEGLNLWKDNKEWFCAYKTVEQVQQWLRKVEIQYFTTLGFRVYLLTVNEYQMGDYQVIFTKDSIVSKEDVTSLFV